MRTNPQKTADLVAFSEEILKGKPHFLCNDILMISNFLTTIKSQYYLKVFPAFSPNTKWIMIG